MNQTQLTGPDNQPIKVLIVEDDRLYSRLAIDVLEGTQRYTATTAQRGIEMFQHLRPDITFIDIGLPDANGLHLLAQMKRIFPEAFIVVLTASRVTDDVAKAKYLGAAGYIVKPFNRGKIRTYLDLYHDYLRQIEQLDSDALLQIYQECFDKAEALQLNFDSKQTPMQLRHKERDLLMRSWRVMYLDDDADTAQRVQQRLEQSGCMMEAICNPQEAKQALSKFNYQLIFINQEMAETSGIKVAKDLRRAEIEIPIALITEDVYLASDSTHRHLNIAAYIHKPLKYNSLLDVMSEQIEKHLEERDGGYVA